MHIVPDRGAISCLVVSPEEGEEVGPATQQLRPRQISWHYLAHVAQVIHTVCIASVIRVCGLFFASPITPEAEAGTA